MKNNINYEILTISTLPIANQNPGTSGLRKKTRVFMEINYLQNYIQSVFNIIDIKDKNIAIGGDGRFFNSEAMNIILSMGIANGVKSILVAKNGILSTPAMSNLIRKNKLDYGIILSASHNPAGIDGDFGIKINASNGAPCPEALANKIYEETTKITSYNILKNFSFDDSSVGSHTFNNTKLDIIDGIVDYVLMLKEIFDFDLIKHYLQSNNISLLYNGFSGVTGGYAKAIFVDNLGLSADCLLNVEPKEDFGNLIPDPNPHSAKEYMDFANNKQVNFAMACDADGDRHFIFTKTHCLEPSDALALVINYAHLIPYYGAISGVARSKSTSNMVDIVAKANNIPTYIVPTGWKFFANLLDNNLITFCGEESFGLGSKHIREKDGLWALLCYLFIMAKTNKSLDELIENLWQEHGRVYFARQDYENLNDDTANLVIDNINNTITESFINSQNHGEVITLISKEQFNYMDVIDKKHYNNQGLVLNLNYKDSINKINNSASVIIRVSGTGTIGKTIRIYYYSHNLHILNTNKHIYLQPLYEYVAKLINLNIKANAVI